MAVENLIVGSYGDIKSGKTSFGLTFPRPIVHFNLDMGFHRASHRFPKHQVVTQWEPLSPQLLAANQDILSKDYFLPVRFPGMRLQGVLDLWMGAIIPELVAAITDTNTRSILIDTGTVMWQIAKDAQLERVQQRDSGRSNLNQYEYTLPNQEIRSLLGAIRASGKNGYITHHVGGIYKDMPGPTGRVQSMRVGDTWDGWNHMGAVVDVIGRNRIVDEDAKTVPPSINKVPILDIETCGYTLKAEGKSLPYPTFEALLNIINLFREQDTQEALSG